MSLNRGPRIAAFAICFSISCGLAGCGGGGKSEKEASESVSGKVTLNGQPVAGQVVFVGSDNKELVSLIGADGSYTVINPPKGEVDIMVRSMPGVAGLPGAPPPKDGNAPKPTNAGVDAPAKYGKPKNGLKFTVTGGKQTHNLEL